MGYSVYSILFHPGYPPANESALMYEYSISQNNATNIREVVLYHNTIRSVLILFSLFTQSPNSTKHSPPALALLRKKTKETQSKKT